MINWTLQLMSNISFYGSVIGGGGTESAAGRGSNPGAKGKEGMNGKGGKFGREGKPMPGNGKKLGVMLAASCCSCGTCGLSINVGSSEYIGTVSNTASPSGGGGAPSSEPNCSVLDGSWRASMRRLWAEHKLKGWRKIEAIMRKWTRVEEEEYLEAMGVDRVWLMINEDYSYVMIGLNCVRFYTGRKGM